MPALAGQVVFICGEVLPHISILNSTSESSDRRNHQYSCGCKRDEDVPEVSAQWVRYKVSPFSSPSTPLSRSISRFPRYFRRRSRGAGCANSTSDSVRKINRTTSEDQQLVAHQLAAKVGKDRRTFGQARPLLLAAPGRGPCDSTTVWEHGPADRVAALASGIGQPPTERISVEVGEGPERCQGNRSKEG